MPSHRSSAGAALVALFTFGSAHGADFDCPAVPAALPHESWGAGRLGSADELYRRVHEGLGHWSDDPALEQAVVDSLRELLLREPEASRGYVEFARYALKYGTIDYLTLTPVVYDNVERMLAQALELDPVSASAWAFEGRFRQYRRGFVEHLGNGKPYLEALEIAERLDRRHPDVVFAWADAPALMFEPETIAARLNELAEADDWPDFVTAAALRRLADRYARMGRHGAALRAAEDAIEIEPGNPDNWLEHAAIALEQQADPERALESALTAECIAPGPDSNRQIALTLYAAWATDNAGRAEPSLDDDRLVEAFDRLPSVAEAMTYLAEHERLASLVEVFIEVGLSPDVQDPRFGAPLMQATLRRHANNSRHGSQSGDSG